MTAPRTLRMPAPVPSRVGLAVLDGGGRLLGVLVYDERQFHAGACRGCWWAAYDRPSLSGVARELRDHLATAHGAQGRLTLGLRDWRMGVPDRSVRQVRAALETKEAA